MKKLFYIGVIAMIVASCSTGQYTTGGGYEDDLYYNPKEKPLVVQEVEEQLPDVSVQEKNELLEIAKRSVAENPDKYPDITNIDRIEIESVEYKTNTKTGGIDTIIEIMSQGYWINGFQGSNSELEEAMRVIDQYPNGFGYFGQGYSIGENLSFDSDWNVYTRDGKYWWFPRVTNLTMYNQFMFGRYPRYEWTVVWDSPHYDYWDFDYHFGWSSYSRWRSYDRWHYGGYWRDPYWYSPSWHFSVGYHPWYTHNQWYDYPYYRRYYGRHSNHKWHNNNYRYGPRNSMYTKTVRSNTGGTTYRSTSGLKSVTRGTRSSVRGTTTTTRRPVSTRGGVSTVKSRSTTGRVSTRGTGTKSRYRSSGNTVKSKGSTNQRSRYSSKTTTTKTTTQSKKSNVRRYNKPKSTTRPTYNRGNSRTRTKKTYNKGTSKTRSTYKRAPSRSSSSNSKYNRKSSGSYNKSGSSKSRTYNPSSSRSRSSSSSSRSSGSTTKSSSSRSSSSGTTRRSRTR